MGGASAYSKQVWPLPSACTTLHFGYYFLLIPIAWLQVMTIIL